MKKERERERKDIKQYYMDGAAEMERAPGMQKSVIQSGTKSI